MEPQKSSGKPLVNSKVGGWFKKNAAEVGRTVFTLGKTIASGVAGYFNVNVKISGEDLYRLYKSIDLSNKLIVFEDLERSGVDVFEILGYVNSLVEQDGAKVLLIANEDEIIKRLSGKSVLDDIKKSANNSETKAERDVPYTLLTKYREQKEKTIGDTIVYKPNKPVAISNILETSVEYNLAIQMADAFVNHYSNKSMIFVTSHSPAFINLDKDDVALYRCFNDSNKTVIYEAKKAGAKPDVAIELGYFRLQEELFNEYVKKKKELDNSLEEVKLIRERIKSIELPVLITEGETDVLILRTAWEKLYTDKEMPFSIKSCDIGGEGKEAGCGILKNYLVNHTFDAPNVVIGLFNYDEAGSKAYESLKMFSSDASGAFKKSRNCKAYAIRLPAPNSKKVFIEHNNLCIEFLFDEKYLFTELEGRKLIVEKGKTHTIFQNKVIREELLSELWFGRIDKSTKMFFAERIVPTLPAEAFVNFVPLFDLLMEIVNA